MKRSLVFVVVALAVGLASMQVDAAKRFGGGSSLGKQRPAPTQKDATSVAPAQAAPAAPAAAPATPAAPPPKPSFMSKWGGLIAGLGMGALLGSLFSGNMGGLGTILLVLLAGLVVFAVVRALAARRAPAAKPMQFAGIGSAVGQAEPANAGSGAAIATEARREPAFEAPAAPAAPLPPGFEKEPFLRVAKTSFIRLQAANDAKDFDDIRDYTTPEMFAELSMQIRERGDAPQKTDVVLLETQLVEAVVEGDYAIASVRFYGLIRENDAANPEPFDEVWHVRRNLKDPKATWLIAGIQQSG